MKTKSEYVGILKWAKKIKAIEILGNKCEKCGNTNLFHLTFHHKFEKEFNINDIKYSRWEIIEKEIKKCILLCHNCHNELHFSDEKCRRRTDNKKLFLEIKNNDGCELCGYNDYNCSLHFHHIDEKKYKFSQLEIEFKTIDNLSEEILDELNKCQIMCANCHIELHTNVEFFNKNKIEIYEKSENLRKNTPRIDRNIVKKMYFEDKLRQIDIVKHFNCSKGTISGIIKNMLL